MAVDYFLKIQGIEGESQDDKHKGEFDIISWSWGGNQTGTAHLGSGAGSGKVQVQDFHFTTVASKGSPKLVQEMCKGRHIDECVLVCRKAAGDTPIEYFKITFKHCLVSSYQTGGSRNDEIFVESFALNFREFKIEYAEQNKDGSKGATTDFAYDVAANKVK